MIIHAPEASSDYTSLSEAILNAPRNPNVPMIGAMVISQLAAKTGLDKELAAKGFRRFRPLMCGSMGVLLETTDHQVIRICQEREHADLSLFRAKALQEVQAIERHEFKTLTYEILPEFSLNGDEQAFHYLTHNLEERGHLLPYQDMKREDAGYSRDGKIAFWLDPDAMDSTKSYPYDPVKDAAWVVAAPGKKSKQFDLPEGVISKQEADCPALMDGRARGVLTDDDKVVLEALKDGRLFGGVNPKDKAQLQMDTLNALREERPDCFKGVTLSNLPEFMDYVFDKGMYPKQAVERIQKMHAGKMDVPFKVDVKTGQAVHLGKMMVHSQGNEIT